MLAGRKANEMVDFMAQSSCILVKTFVQEGGVVFTGSAPVRGNQVGISECLITQLGLVSICMMLRRINPMGLFLTSTSHDKPRRYIQYVG